MALPTNYNHFSTLTLHYSFNLPMLTDQVTGKWPECRIVEKVKVLEMCAKGFSQSGISKQLDIPRTTIRGIIKEWKADHKLQPILRTGWPKIHISRAKRHLYSIFNANSCTLLSKVAMESGLVCTTARVLGGNKSARSVKIMQKTHPLTYLGNFITQIG